MHRCGGKPITTARIGDQPMTCVICLKEIVGKHRRLNIQKDPVCEACWKDLCREPLPANGEEYLRRLQELTFKKRLED